MLVSGIGRKRRDKNGTATCASTTTSGGGTGVSQRVLRAGRCDDFRDPDFAHCPDAELLPRAIVRFQRRANEVMLLIREAFLRGVSTRQVGRVVAILTGEPVSAQTVSRLSRHPDRLVKLFQQAGPIELVHDVVKNELGGKALPSKYFGANAAWVRFAVVAHNVLAALRRLALPPELLTARRKRLRFLIFNTPGRPVQHARSLLLRLASLAQWIVAYREACGCCRCRVEPAGAKKSQLSKDFQATFSNSRSKYIIPSWGNNL